MAKIFVINSRGEKETFSRKKVYRSAKRSGASNKLARSISDTISREIYPGIKTSDIFARIKQLLKKESLGVALKFSLKKGIRDLGPTGFPFEKYVRDIMKNLGYRVEPNKFLPGKCISDYEIDFLAEKNNTIYIGECKYRQYLGEKVDSQDALYNQARFLDISSGNYFKSKKYQGKKIKSMLVTNAKFSQRAQDYCCCVGVKALGWNYPKDKGLEHFIDGKKLYPVTVLPGLRGRLKNVLVEEGIILTKTLLEMDIQKFSKRRRIPLNQLENLVKQAKTLLD